MRRTAPRGADPGHAPAIRALFVAGPTASGKTSIAVAVAERTGAEIISCDSRQLFEGMRIGTAAPTDGDRRRVPHHLVGVAPPHTSWSAGRWARAAERVLHDLAARDRPALIVGGSGLYARALRRGIAKLPSNRALREQLESEWRGEPPGRLHARLWRLDPDAARDIHPHNRHRVLRALEVCLTSGRRVSELWQADRDAPERFPAPMMALRVARDVLYARVDRRVEEMFRAGLVDEARALRARGFGPSWPAYRTLGYPEAVACAEGRLPPSEAIGRVQRLTRAFARRQLTWLRREAEIEWLDLDPGRPDAVIASLASALEGLHPTPLKPLDAPARSG